MLLDGKPAGQVALESLQESWSYGQLEFGSRKIGAFLLASGAQRGDRVLLIAQNSYFWVVSYLGILRAGLVCVPLPTSISDAELAYITEATDSRCACVDPGILARIGQNTSGCIMVSGAPRSTDIGRINVHHFDCVLHWDADDAGFPHLDPDTLAALMYTSGSTGRPRGVMVTHGNIIANTNSIIEYLSLTAEDSILTVLPFHYCFGTSLLHTHLAVGGRLVLENGFMYTEALLRHLQNSECTGFAGVPSHYQILLRRSSIRSMRFPHLRYVQQAGGHLAPAFIRELRQALPKTQIFVMYGQTEATARLSFVPPDTLDRKIGSIGKAIPGVRLSVVNEHGDEAPPGELGEIVAEGDNIAIGYWQEPEETAASFRNGKLYTGDLATVDGDGFIYIADRAKDFVKIGGKRTSCRSIEENMLEFEDLLEVAVIGIPDSVAGEALKVFVVPRDRGDTQFLQRFRAFCVERLPFQHIPKEVAQLDALPKNSSGKVLKSVLKSFGTTIREGP